MYKEKMRQLSVKTQNYSMRQKLCYIISNGGYMSVLVTLTALYLIISGIQYWITDYVVSVLGHTKETAFIVYICVGALGPIAGVGFSGCIFDRMGGYHGRNTPVVFTIFLIISGSLGIISVLFTNVYIMSTCIMLQLFFGGMTVPVLTGYMIA